MKINVPSCLPGTRKLIAKLPLKGYDMEKQRAHYDLRAIQTQMSTVAGLRMTITARHNALRAGVTLQTAVSIIQSLNRTCFYKSMTTHQNHEVWQDVYHGTWRGKGLYIKFQQDAAGYFTISFKEL